MCAAWPARAGGQPVQPVQPVQAGEAVWHLRAGLNVAALTCRGRGRAPVAADYGRVLGRHRALLAAAYAAERQRYGAGFDRHETRTYNRFSNQRSPERFCSHAASVANRAAGLGSPELSRQAGALLGDLE